MWSRRPVVTLRSGGMCTCLITPASVPCSPSTSLQSAFKFCTENHYPLPHPQLRRSQPGVAVPPGDRPSARPSADAVSAAGARLPARLSRQLLAEPARALRLGSRPPQDHPEARAQGSAHLGHAARWVTNEAPPILKGGHIWFLFICCLQLCPWSRRYYITYNKIKDLYMCKEKRKKGKKVTIHFSWLPCEERQPWQDLCWEYTQIWRLLWGSGWIHSRFTKFKPLCFFKSNNNNNNDNRIMVGGCDADYRYQKK